MFTKLSDKSDPYPVSHQVQIHFMLLTQPSLLLFFTSHYHSPTLTTITTIFLTLTPSHYPPTLTTLTITLPHAHHLSHTPNHHHHHSPTLTTITILPHSPPSLSHTHNHHHHSPTYTNIISLSNTLNSTHSLPSLTLTTITITLSHSLPSLPHSQPLPLLSHALNHHSPPLTTITTTLR